MSVGLRLLGAGLLLLTGWGAGCWLTGKKRARLRALEELLALMGTVRNEIVYRAAPLSDILVGLRKSGALGELALENCQRLDRLPRPAALTASDWEQLGPFFGGLGCAAGAESERRCLYYEQRCAALRDAARRDYEQAKQLYSKAGLCSGALAALLLF